LFSQFWAVCKGIFDFILEKLPEDIKLRAKKEVGGSISLPGFFCSIFFDQKFWQFFLQKICFLNLHRE
jgi:hypothetical protein